MLVDLEGLRARVTGGRAVWAEITEAENKEPGSVWDLGRRLWSPTAYDGGADRYRIMREVQEGDPVLHLVKGRWPDGVRDRRLLGISRAAGSFIETEEEPPRAGAWGGRSSYYYIPLSGFQQLTSPFSIDFFARAYCDEIFAEIKEDRPADFPFQTYRNTVRPRQGAYLARVTPRLLQGLLEAMGIELSRLEADGQAKLATSSDDVPPEHLEFLEGQRRKREAYFFARNPNLAKAAKAHHGTACMACGFDFQEVYGELGEGYIECHHLDPLSERPQGDWSEEATTSLNQVAVLCANCHRMIHRRRPALSMEELIEALRWNKSSSRMRSLLREREPAGRPRS